MEVGSSDPPTTLRDGVFGEPLILLLLTKKNGTDGRTVGIFLAIFYVQKKGSFRFRQKKPNTYHHCGSEALNNFESRIRLPRNLAKRVRTSPHLGKVCGLFLGPVKTRLQGWMTCDVGDGRWKATPGESVGRFAAGGEAGRRSPGPRTGARGPGAVGELPSAAGTEGS